MPFEVVISDMLHYLRMNSDQFKALLSKYCLPKTLENIYHEWLQNSLERQVLL